MQIYDTLMDAYLALAVVFTLFLPRMVPQLELQLLLMGLYFNFSGMILGINLDLEEEQARKLEMKNNISEDGLLL